MTIVGFAKQSVESSSLNLPDPLIMIIYTFFYLTELFNSVDGDGLEISKDGNTVKRIGKNGHWVYGKIGIDPDSKTLNIWEIKVDRRKHRFGLGLAVCEQDDIDEGYANPSYWVLCSKYKSVIKCDSRDDIELDDVIVGQGDIVTMELNLKVRKIKFSIHDRQYDVGLDDEMADEGLKYYLVCGIGNFGTDFGHQMSIVHFSSCTQ